jgi:hypothetical protein
VSLSPSERDSVIWATRGRTWGFRFLLTAGFRDPLPRYEQAYEGLGDAETIWARVGPAVALRLPDPLGRTDEAGRIIPHDFVLFGNLAVVTSSLEIGRSTVWPLVAGAYAEIWKVPTPPAAEDLDRLL